MYRKYKAVKTEINGIKFDSKMEANRYATLLTLERSGRIKNLILQPSFLLQESFKKNGITYRAINYIADFAYIDTQTGDEVIEDVKGVETDVFKLKHKLFEYKYPEKTLRLVRGRNG